MDRRGILRGTAAGAGGALLAGSPFAALLARQARAALVEGGVQVAPARSPYGGIAPKLDQATELPLLRLPQGFSYSSFGWTGDRMQDGKPTPPLHDGMGITRVDGGGERAVITLVRNHEIDGVREAFLRNHSVYDPSAGGGNTALRFSGGRWLASRPVLAGTVRNCAGGATPWGSWLSCEETGAGTRDGFERDHGYVFEVPSPELGRATGRPIREMGRFRHEAVAVDPRNSNVYQSEDDASGLFRFVPADTSMRLGSLAQGGRLEMLKLLGQPRANLTAPRRGDRHRAGWVAIEDPDGTAAGTPFDEGFDKGGARFARLEGMSCHRGTVYFADTSAGPAGRGVIWTFTPDGPSPGSDGVLEALFVSGSIDAGSAPDHLTLSPRGGLLFCEGGGSDPIRLVGLTGQGLAYPFCANNIVVDRQDLARAGKTVEPGDYRNRELAGACFDPSGRYLFVNAQTPGITFAITGPWERGNL